VRVLTQNLWIDGTTCELVFDKPVDGAWASDHFGVVADLEPPA
jgi:hypothetical protein